MEDRGDAAGCPLESLLELEPQLLEAIERPLRAFFVTFLEADGATPPRPMDPGVRQV